MMQTPKPSEEGIVKLKKKKKKKKDKKKVWGGYDGKGEFVLPQENETAKKAEEEKVEAPNSEESKPKEPEVED